MAAILIADVPQGNQQTQSSDIYPDLLHISIKIGTRFPNKKQSRSREASMWLVVRLSDLSRSRGPIIVTEGRCCQIKQCAYRRQSLVKLGQVPGTIPIQVNGKKYWCNWSWIFSPYFQSAHGTLPCGTQQVIVYVRAQVAAPHVRGIEVEMLIA
ncbi:uncharacterized protein BCR38DRAFT_126746 [Pseudomassariella vexata]|uniref:Uncharacterized protein n=1 Tax=Pseudomassariella vexata TaxID=1141098 RepID=A0A1Y2D860_9PEZI|nr:uncharacterized protein BCR38DRAFT_126746 [Pseudomassariella vexata]ORY55306.1 hypothetical protein BCR38DRAFT_126746 [Pseudomassariella vexata]